MPLHTANKGKKNKPFTGKMAFRNTKPKEGEPKVKTVDGDKWYFCTHHGKWGAHTYEQCRKRQKEDKDNEANGISASLAQVGINDVEIAEDFMSE